MAQSGKASIKRGKPSYFMSILGVTLVLFLLGIIGWLIINANKLGDHFKESVEVNVYLRSDLNPKDSAALVDYIASRPYVKSYTYTTKEMAKKKYIADGNESWDKILTENPLDNSIDFKIKKEYLNTDTLAKIKQDLLQNVYVKEVDYPEALIGTMSKNIRLVSVVLLIIAFIIAIVVIFLIDNTIRLAMFSNRFLIKTMQMVGATRGFIAKPLDLKAIGNGAVSGAIASLILYFIIMVVERYVGWFKAVHDNGLLFLLFFILILLGISITVFSTHRSVLKYLRMKLDDLY
ncbi:MAG TPA: permease-like cell division protein FtsX [Chitinophagaceae bacterium]|nr:permease-like cell division protein FtsX [Chitinophagaceae bacterium]